MKNIRIRDCALIWSKIGRQLQAFLVKNLIILFLTLDGTEWYKDLSYSSVSL
jgi:hypothetical protein